MPSSWINSKRLRLILAGGAVALELIWWRASHQPEHVRPFHTESPAPSVPLSVLTHNVTNAAVPAATLGRRRLQAACEDLRKETNAETIRQKLALLRLELAAMPKNEAVTAIRQFLDSTEDASTHLGFKLASNGMLDDAPTLRTYLLDELGRLDPAAAAEYAKDILTSMDSADEWAVALRNLAAGDASDEGRDLLAQKTAQMLQYSPWQQNPSTGFLEAFDVAVYLGGTDLVPILTDMVRSQDNPALAHAAFLAMDRLVINDPVDVLQSLQDDPDLMQGRESTRADYFARANVSDPEQQAILKSYLLDPNISTAELRAFAGIFPNANFMISPNLLTQSTTLTHDALVNLDTQSLALAQQWVADPHFERVAPELQMVIQRLEGFAAQAKQGP